MSKTLEQKISELRLDLDKLREENDRLTVEATRWGEKRNSMHEQIKSLRVEAANLKEKRDALNHRVQELKAARNRTKLELRGNKEQILECRERVRALQGRKGQKNRDDLKKEIETLEWRIHTTRLTLKEESALIEVVKQLEAQLLIQNQILELKEKIKTLENEREETRSMGELTHIKLSELAEQSQTFHEKRLDLLDKLRSFQADADNAHQKFVQAKTQAQEVRKRQIKTSRQIRIFNEQLRVAEEERQANLKSIIRKELEEKAVKKLKRGEKLTWDEFQILSEKGII